MPTNVGMYLRLSLADADLGKDNKDESNSIETQRGLIRTFLERRPEFDGKIIEYVDDGYSGTNFDRPGFKRMIDDAKNGIIQVIIVKDLSRLGRDYIGVGDYLEQVFPVLGIRFIALNSNYDSNNYIGKTMDLETSVSNLINSMYSKDLSKKIKSAYRARWKAGINTSTVAPYGYIRQKDRSWAIDPEAAEVVKKIFSLASSGKDIKYIVDYLNKRKIPTPAEHLNGLKASTNKEYAIKCKEPRWDKSRVYRIIRNQSYTGIMEFGRMNRLVVGSRTLKKAGKNELTVIENDHPALVSEETYSRAQDVINALNNPSPRTPQNNPLTGKLYCGNCGLSMSYTNAASPRICCAHGMSVGIYSDCIKGTFEAKEIEARVLYFLRQQVKIIMELTKQVREDRETKTGIYENARKKLKDAIDSLNDDRIMLYEKYANGHISRERYLADKEQMNTKLESIQGQLDEMESDRKKEDTFLFEADRIANRCRKMTSRSRLTKEIADAYIETVIFHDKDDLEIEFKFEDVIKEKLESDSLTNNSQ